MLAALKELLVSHTWNLFLRRESSLETGCLVKADRERKIMVCLAGEPVQDINPVQWKERHPAEKPHCRWVYFWARGWFYRLFPSPEILLLWGVLDCAHIWCASQPSHRQEGWNTISVFSIPGTSAFHSRLVMAKNPCLLATLQKTYHLEKLQECYCSSEKL